ncbi:MAG: membrane dipeptidase [Rhodospirillaceae bacterium]|nr:membrane dipeptidase [Rhodospirillaceae bacterium]|tara:strand:- start:2519 stop:3523 length:1005 start_codon:yes stop_codon:yes gene_type:complete
MDMSARQLYTDALVWDSHAGFELNSERDLETLSIWRDAGVDFLSVNVGYDVWSWQRTIKALALAISWLDKHKDFQIIGTVDELDRARSAGQMAVAFDIEGMNALDGSVEMVDIYHRLGVRQMLFAYNLNNQAGGGCHDEDLGLTAFGKSVIASMNRVGMLIDCSHTGYRSTMEAMEASTDPVVFSHSNARKMWDHQRNITDEQAMACAGGGGVVGVNGIGIFVGDNDISTPSIVNHIVYYLDLIGSEHVGIGLDYFADMGDVGDLNTTLSNNEDFWPKSQYPAGGVRCAKPEQLVEIAENLLKRGCDYSEIQGVLGGNFRRVAAEVWKNPRESR